MGENQKQMLDQNTYTFVDSKGDFEITVSVDFLKKVPKPEEVIRYSLFAEHHCARFLHNPKGFAIKHIVTGKGEYWLNGDKITDEEGAKLTHNNNFNDKLLNDVLKD